MRKKALSILLAIWSAMSVMLAADPMATTFSYDECEGSLTPYPNVQTAVVPDGLTPVLINHVGRHGSRYPASPAHCNTLKGALLRADSIGTITPLGKKLLQLTNDIIAASDGRWGALDSLGEAEERGIAWRMFAAYPQVFQNAKVNAISSYSPRTMMSMYAFTHQLDRLSNRMQFTTSTGRCNSQLMRPFDVDQDYIDFRKEGKADEPYLAYFKQNCPVSAIERVFGKGFPYQSDEEKQNLAITEYYVIASLSAMAMPNDASAFFTVEEYNALWSCFNLRQYLQRTASTVSSVPADIAAALLLDIIATTDAYLDGTSDIAVHLRFGHAETLMPLLSLMRVPGCYYLTNYFDTVAQHWQDFNVVPMAANMQLIIFRDQNGNNLARLDLNEKPIAIMPGNDNVYVEWGKLRDYLMNLVPLHLQY